MTVTRKSRAIIGLVGTLALAIPLTAQAQDTTSVRDTISSQQARSDTAQQDAATWGYSADSATAVQNPAGYRGMERDTTMFPAGNDTATAGADATSRINQRARQDSLEGAEGQNPPGYRGMERPAGLDSVGQSGDTAGAMKATTTKKTDKATKKKKDKATKKRTTSEQNPPGYRGMERPAALDSAAQSSDTAGDREADAGADATNRVNQRARQDTVQGAAQQNPPGYRGMERPAALDSAAVQQGDTGSSEPQ